MRHDYKFLSEQKKGISSSLIPRRSHILFVSAITAGFFLASSLLPEKADANKAETNLPDVQHASGNDLELKRVIESLPLPQESQTNSIQLPLPTTATTSTNQLQWEKVTVKSGDTMARIFSKQQLSASLLHRIVHINKQTRQLARVIPGQTLRFGTDTDGKLQKLVYQRDIANSLIIEREGDSFNARLQNQPLDKRVAHASARIDSSLFLAGQQAGLSDNMTMRVANIFGWDIDFALDIRQGDHFTVIYEEVYMGDKKIRDGEVIAAEFHNRGNTYRAIRYTDASGRTSYYTPKGMSMRKAFLRTPVAFSRISSRFNLRRKHPVLNKIRAHKGVDYAAPRGTPIKATGDGRIVFKGRKGGYGKTIIIKHGSAYSTLYAHMRSYNRKARMGSRVKQGQVIGYVGSTGLATGPHLHYEFRLNGAVRNPLTVRLPTASPLPKKYRQDFTTKAQPLLAQLNLITRNSLALLSK